MRRVSSRYDDRAVITSPSNAQVKRLVALRHRRRRREEGVSLVEGYPELALALDAGVVPRTLYWCRALVDPSTAPVVDRVSALGTSVVELGKEAFAKASYREAPDGWLAVVPDPARPLSGLQPGDSPLLLVCEAVEKPGNLGAMVRTAEAAGADAVIAASPVADWGNPNVVRASKGTVFAVPVVAAGSGEVLGWLRDHGVAVAVATPDGEYGLSGADLSGPVAVVVGAEHEGVSQTWLDAADVTIRIPMFGRVNSLNVSASAAIVLYEAVRQRRSAVGS